jgi:TrmH family RNA methyltransferase
VDCYNSKVVQATMGSLSRVQINYVNLKEVLEASPSPILVADLDGENLYQTSLPEKAVLVLGNESNGISAELKGLKDRLLTIPRFGSDTESLNVATAAAVILSEFRRNQ